MHYKGHGMTTNTERRRSERRDFNVPGVADFGNGNVFDAEIINLSPEGLLINVFDIVALPNELFEISFLLAGKSKTIQAACKAVWSSVSTNGIEIGALYNNFPNKEIQTYWEELPELLRDRVV